MTDIEPGCHDPFPGELRGDCPESSPRTSGDLPYFCTRDAGHPPPHVAIANLAPALAAELGLSAAGDVVAAVWPPFRELDVPPVREVGS